MAECILLKSGGGETSSDCTATAADILASKTAIYSTSNDDPANGTMADYSSTTKSATASLDSTNEQLLMTVPATGKYSIASKLYSAYSTIRSLIGLTAAKIATGNTILGLAGTYTGIGTAVASNVLYGKTFSSASLSNATGTMPHLTNNASITHTTDNTTKVILGDAAFANTNSDSTKRVCIRYNDSAGYITSNTLFAVDQSTMASAIGLTSDMMGSNQSCLGITGTGHYITSIQSQIWSGTIPTTSGDWASFVTIGSYYTQYPYLILEIYSSSAQGYNSTRGSMAVYTAFVTLGKGSTSGTDTDEVHSFYISDSNIENSNSSIPYRVLQLRRDSNGTIYLRGRAGSTFTYVNGTASTWYVRAIAGSDVDMRSKYTSKGAVE